VSVENAASILAQDGPIARHLARRGGRFESRAEQLTMTGAVERAMASKGHVLVEAGTGTGKTFAYLVPAIRRCVEHGEIVVVSTHTIALQEQLVTRDIPMLMAALGLDQPTTKLTTDGARDDEDEPSSSLPLRPVLVKGRGNYVSIRRLKLASQRQDKLFADPAARRSLHAVEDWAYGTADGTLSTLPPLERPGIWDRVQSDSGNCMGRKCPTYEQCFYQQARRQMERGNLLVVNHALFFADLSLRAQEAGFLPRYDHVIFDEAHAVEDVAGEHFGHTLTEGRVQHLLTTLYQGRTGKGFLVQLASSVREMETLERAVSLVDRAGAAARAFFDGLMRLLDGARGSPFGGEAAGGAGPSILRLRKPHAFEDPLSPAMRDLALALSALKECTTNEADAYELNAYSQRAAMIAAKAQILVEQSSPGCVYWTEASGAEGEGASRVRRVTVACAPIEVAPLLKQHLFAQGHSVVLTSATLATRTPRDDESTESAETAFAHTLSRLGAEGASTLRLGSPFHYERQAELYVHRGLEDAWDRAGRGKERQAPPRTSQDEHWPDANALFGQSLPKREERVRPERQAAGVSPVARAILAHARQTGGGVFVLWTSYSALYRTARELEEPLKALGLPMLVQGKDGSRSEFLERFRSHGSSVLMGAASFWQGVDVPGEALRCVIIVKLPFDPPDRPVTQARGELILSRGGDPFREDALPRAILRFKQGFGRLIRTREDRGRVVVLDGRILSSGYGRSFVQALPEGVPMRVVDGPELGEANGRRIEREDSP
jgi:ATP-dependent DNA helicase DinG